jgi:hypothetical protein
MNDTNGNPVVPGTYYYSRPDWDGPSRFPCVVKRDAVGMMIVEFGADTNPTAIGNIPADARFQPRKAPRSITDTEWRTGFIYRPVSNIVMNEKGPGGRREVDLFRSGEPSYPSPEDFHALAAFALHGHQLGFTRRDVSLLRSAAEHDANIASMYGPTGPKEIGWKWQLADRIEALLPPEEEALDTQGK